jgi:long-chain acyl-CoA synthetase
MFAPPMTARLVRHPEAGNYDYSSLKNIITSAAPISAELLKEASSVFGDVYIELFGTTETCLLGTFLQPEERALEGPLSNRLTSVGKACLGYMIKVIDDNGNEVKTGEVGELLICGDAVATGYWNMPDAPDFKDGWWHSGDLALVDEDKYIHIVDRKKDMILSGGENIYPREVEDVIATHPGVFLVSVIGVPDEQWGESVKAVIVPSEGAEITEEEIIEYCKARLSSYKKPRSVDFVDISDMPLMAGGYKVIKRELRDKYRKKFMDKTGKKIDRWGTI